MSKQLVDKIEGHLEIGRNDNYEVVVNIPPMKKKREQHKTNCAYRGNTEELCNCGIEYEHIEFSPNQARNLAHLLLKHAADAETEFREREDAEIREKAAVIPVDRNARTLANGGPVSDDHREINPATGQQKDYVVLSAEERAKGFVRPVRRTYTHLKCGTTTTISIPIAETYARDPAFYSGTFCCNCREHKPLNEFVWTGTDEQVGS